MTKTLIMTRCQYLRAGDLLTATSRRVTGVSRGARTPRGKVEVTLDDGLTRTWGSNTLVRVEREGDRSTG